MRLESATPSNPNISDGAEAFKVSYKSKGTPPHPKVTAFLILHYKTGVSKRLEILHLVSVFSSHQTNYVGGFTTFILLIGLKAKTGTSLLYTNKQLLGYKHTLVCVPWVRRELLMLSLWCLPQ